MSKRIFSLLSLLFFGYAIAYSQEASYTWWDPAKSTFPVLEGQAWTKELQNPYDRLPARAQKIVREKVWELSGNSAGLMLRFKSNSTEIAVRYKVSGPKAMNHMPATSVSGIDLYAVSADGNWLWCAGKYSMGDTIEYRFRGLEPNDPYHQKGREYRLYFPLYNTVQWLEIGVPNTAAFNPLPLRTEKPIVVYGTSIAQGACASRPGMAWPAILGRMMDRPVINLGFSGNGRLEPEVIALISEIDAKLFILDCLPNLDASGTAQAEQVKDKVIQSVKKLRQKATATPILLAEHCGFTNEAIHPGNRQSYQALNKAQQEAFQQLKSEGFNQVYLISKDDIGLSTESTVDGIHPTDVGMREYALGYEKSVRKILDEPAGTLTTTKPIIQNRDAKVYDWDQRHREILAMNKVSPPRIVFLGNSITHFWGGEPKNSVINGEDSWNEVMRPLGVRNFGYGWDRIENVLWRVYHDELSGYRASQIVILIGTNNRGMNTNEQILDGLKFLVQAIKDRQPGADILMLGIYPCRKDEQRIADINRGIAKAAGEMNVGYLDPGRVLLDGSGNINESLFTDGLHPNAEGYRRLAKEMIPYLKPMEKIPAKTKK